MADNQTKFEYIIEILKRGDTKSAVQEFEKLQASTEKTTGSMEKLTSAGEKLLAFFGAELVLKGALEGFLENEKATAKLEQALKKAGLATTAFKTEMQDMIEELKNSTTFTDDEITNVAAKLISLKAPKESIKQITEAVLDLSTLMDKDLNRATQAVAQGLHGNFEAFKQLGFQVDDTASTADNFNSVLKQLADTAGGQARAAVNTLGGEIAQTKKQIKEMQDEIGGGLAKAFSKFTEGLRYIGTWTDWENQLKAIDNLKQSYVGLADSLRATLIEKTKLGEVTKEQAATIHAEISAVQESLRYFQSRGLLDNPAGWKQANEVLANAQGKLAGVASSVGKPGLLSTSRSSEVVGPALPPGWVDPDQQKKALLEIQTLREGMTAAALDGFARERVVVGANYEERLRQIQTLSSQAGLSIEEKSKLEEEAARAYLAQTYEIASKEEEVRSKAAMDEYEQTKAYLEAEGQLRDQIVQSELQGQELEMYTATRNHERRVQQIQEMKGLDEERYARLMQLEDELYQREQQRIQKQKTFAEDMSKSINELELAGVKLFSQGLGHAIVESFEKGGSAFKEFARNFMKQMAEMILQAVIFNALIAAGRAMGLSFAGGGKTIANAQGGLHLAASGFMGMTAGPTVLPKFNVLAGEAGQEMLAVLAKPRTVDMNGVGATIGNIGRERMALVNADTLEQLTGTQRKAAGGYSSGGSFGSPGGVGGTVHITVSMESGLRSDIVNEASNVSVDKVTREMGTHSVLSETTKRLVS
jgi:hypothetical protein